jgi:hypothetical protein
VAAALAVGMVAVIAAGTGGPWSIADRFHLWGGEPTYTEPSVTVRPATPLATPRPTPDTSGWLQPVLWALAVVAVLVVAFFVWRLLPRRTPKAQRPAALGDHVLGQPLTESAPAVQQGLGAAQHLLDTVADPTDAVLAAWVALEQAADRSGHPRRPADTPTEFTVEVLTATPADRGAVTTLLRLYHRARFSGTGVGPEAVATARRCLDDLARSWSAVSTTVPSSPRPTSSPEPTP